MFERFAQLAQARRALQAEDWERAGRLAKAPRIATTKKARAILADAVAGLLGRASRRLGEKDVEGARVDAERVLALDPEHQGAIQLLAKLGGEPVDQDSDRDGSSPDDGSATRVRRAGQGVGTPAGGAESDSADGEAQVVSREFPDRGSPGPRTWGPKEDRTVAGAAASFEQGDWHGARVGLASVLAGHPEHHGARHLLEELDRMVERQEQGLASARQAAREARLRTALETAQGLVSNGPAGEPVLRLVAELQERIDLVDRGVDEIQAVLHRPEGGSPAGLQHCLARLEELGRNNREHAQVTELIALVQGAMSAIERLAPALEQLAKGDRQPALDLLEGLPHSSPLVIPPRKALVEGLLESLDAGVEAGACGAATKDLLKLRGLFGGAAEGSTSPGIESAARVRMDRIAETLESRRANAVAAAEEITKRLDVALSGARGSDPAAERLGARRVLAEARIPWADAGPLDAVEARLAAADASAQALEQATRWAQQGDAVQARRHLAAAGATPPALRTKIFDMKRDLARAQGLADGFLLQVDDAGEFLVVRAETVRIGNIRGKPLELPVLANIASQHARIERKMSFHGGMQDEIVAAEGKVRFESKDVDRQRLQSGDKLTLGDSLGLHYRVPSKRSLTAELRLLGGFQVAGTDRILLMKDRGRDGRILIGPGDGTHVRVPTANGSLEIFAAPDGRIVVRCAGGGTLDGNRFQGEAVLEAGCTVQAAGVSFVVQPWSPEDR